MPVVEYRNHRLIKIKDRTLDVVFSIFQWNSFTITLRQKPGGVMRSLNRTSSLCLVILHRLRETPLGFCLRVIVNEFHTNLEKTTYSVLSVILINLWSEFCCCTFLSILLPDFFI